MKLKNIIVLLTRFLVLTALTNNAQAFDLNGGKILEQVVSDAINNISKTNSNNAGNTTQSANNESGASQNKPTSTNSMPNNNAVASPNRVVDILQLPDYNPASGVLQVFDNPKTYDSKSVTICYSTKVELLSREIFLNAKTKQPETFKGKPLYLYKVKILDTQTNNKVIRTIDQAGNATETQTSETCIGFEGWTRVHRGGGGIHPFWQSAFDAKF